MSKTIISEGKTTQEAIDNGLKELKVSKNQVDVKVLEEEHKKSFFSILTPRVVKVELTVKDNVKEEKNDKQAKKVEEKPKREYEQDENSLNEAKVRVEEFLKEWLNKVDEKLEYSIKVEDYTIMVDIKGEAA